MSERWKYQLKTGLFWGVFMIVFMTLLGDKSFSEQISSGGFYIRLAVYILVGVFFLGYGTWREKIGKPITWSSLFRKNKK